jgi:hypothetical protein
VTPHFDSQSLQLLPSAISRLPECAVFVRPPYGAPCLQLPVAPGPDEVVALGPNEVVDFVVRMPNGQALSAKVNINTSLSSLGMHDISSRGVHSMIDFAPKEPLQDPNANY